MTTLVLPGWTQTYAGKVRNLYVPDSTPEGEEITDVHGDVVLVVASDRISAYDYVLSPAIPDKGVVLTQLSLWWFAQLAGTVADHVVSTIVPDEVAGRAIICRRLDMYPVECVARGYLTGSGLTEYQQNGAVTGIALPDGLVDGSRLPEPIFTPATKAELGAHDQNITFDATVELVGPETARRLRDLTMEIYHRAEAITAERGLILADTKFEFGVDADDRLVLADEVLTPDSSRFWPADTWSPGRAQPSFDKQYVRDWLTSPESGWNRTSDAPPPALPDAVVTRTRDRYLEVYRRITGKDLEL
ncbi:MAG: phosphoribosylaminoimidazolesuccinocarboxamide synthase [Micrococcales bacterium]|nr:phosphoribosylaminoimidazolesuccinocarboxamide synthase [Micrococcales bacterium]MCL2668241.1 phosphoribosylaminoimidazolesuccinocarboxamide synthase [Micrococcales bacterium]